MKLAVIIPTLNARKPLARLLDQLGDTSGKLVGRVVVSDGGSGDGTLEEAVRRGGILALGSAGRGQQLRRGAAFALGDMDNAWLLVLHADTVLPDGWKRMMRAHMEAHPAKAAHFAYGLEGSFWERLVLRGFVRLRELAWSLPYGDQGLLIPAKLYAEVGGYRDMVLFEDVDMVQRLRGRLRRLPGAVRTDISAYRRDGIWRRGWRNLGLLRAYRCGEDVQVLAARYRGRGK